MKHLAFVTMDFYPLTTGEIGRIIHNMLVAMPSSDRARTVVILVGEALDLGLARVAFPEVRFEGLDDVVEVRDSDRYPPKNAYGQTTEWHWRSVCVLRKLLKLEQEGLAFDYIEFPDYCGLGFAATQEKLFEGAFSQAALAVRLHGTEGIAFSTEARPTGRATLVIYDIERKALRDCDRVIAPSMPVADHYRSFYGFDLSEWASRIVLHSFLVLVDNAGIAKSCAVSSNIPLLFLSDLRRAKAPDVFVRACVGFMRLCPEYTGEIHFLSQDKNPEVGGYVEKLIPSDLSHRFKFHDSPVPRAEREQMVSQGVSVFSSLCESFCLPAFEVSLVGGVVLLNGANPAFSELTPWRDAENCIKFDGTVESLVGALQRLFREGPELAPVSPPSDTVPWQATAPPVEFKGLTEGDAEAPLVSVIIPNFNLGAYLPYTLSSVAASGYPNIEIIVCDDASTDPQTIELLGCLAQDFKDRSLTIVYAKYNRGLAGARNLAIRKAKGKYVLTLDADDLISPEFIAKAVAALERNSDYSIVVPQAAYFPHERTEIPQTQSEYVGFLLFYGEALANGFFDNRFSTATVLARRGLFDELKYREDLLAWEDWDFYLRAVMAGKRFIVTNELHFFYRRRENSMISEVANNPRHKALCYYNLRRVQSIQSGRLSFPAYAISAWEEVLAAEFSNAEIRMSTDESQALRRRASEQDRKIAGLRQAVAERGGQIAGLNQAVAERDGQITSLNQDLRAILESTSWRITRPLRWFSIQARLVREHGLSVRIKAFLQKGVRGAARRSFDYVRARPELRVRLRGWAVSLGLKEFLHALDKKIQGKATDNIPSLRELVVTSYKAWTEHFDTPSLEVLDQLASTQNSRAPVLVVARFDKTSELYAESMAKRLVNSIGQLWSAVFLFSSDCNTGEIIRKIRLATNGDSRIGFDSSVVKGKAEIVIFIEGGVLPRSHALHVFAEALRNSSGTLMAYSDEDYLSDEGEASNPWFKPRFSRLLASQGVLLGRMLAFRVAGSESAWILSNLLAASVDVAKFACDYALVLGEERVLHIPHVLFHDAFAQRDPIVVELDLPEVLPKASIVIPTKDRWDLLGPCLESLWLSDWPSELLDVVVVDNGSTDPETLAMLEKLESERKIRVIRDARQFNWSRLNNLAARESDGELLVFLNNDTEVVDPAWLKELAVHALRPGVGAVGCKLLYPDRTVQHGGVIAGIHGVAGHAHLFIQADEGGYCNLANLDHEVSAVTGACLAVTRENFELAGGFNEDFRVAFNDVVFCFTLHTLGLRNVYVSDPLLIHHESKSRGFDDTPEKLAIQRSEARRAWTIHAQLMRDDPFYSPNLSLWIPYERAFAPRRRAAWDNVKDRSLRVMMLSVTHAIGHGVAVVLALQAEAMVRRGFEVIMAGPMSQNDFPYPGCTRVEVHDPLDAATLAADMGVDVIVVETPPFFGVAKWTGAHPPVIAFDHGEPPPDWFPDAVLRKEGLADKDQSLMMAAAVYAISDAIAAESRTPVSGVIANGNSHLGRWNDEMKSRRDKIRSELGWDGCFVVLNVCRFHRGERLYKGVDIFAQVKESVRKLNPDTFDRVLFILCGKGSNEDVVEMTEKGLVVFANVVDQKMIDLYIGADAYANFSQWEGYNLGVGQALAMGLPTIASDIPAHRAFGIDVTNDVDMAAKWILQQVGLSEVRTPRIWDWSKPLAQLIDAIEAVSKTSRKAS